MFSGLRSNELRHLTVDHLDLARGGLLLDADWTKNREEGFQPLPGALLERLKAFVESGETARLYLPVELTRRVPNGGRRGTRKRNSLRNKGVASA